MDEQHDMDHPFETDELETGQLETGQVADNFTDAAEIVAEDTVAEDTVAEGEDVDNPAVEETCSEYLRSWNHLISTTNWEKGRIIHEWREALIAVGAGQVSYADEAWSRRVGNVTPQHVGRLRRVYFRFFDDYQKYTGLFWSHFQAALDWDDAEMWLEGAVQNGWSVASMRNQRWEALGAPDEQRPRDEDIIVAELDEDAPKPDEPIVDSLDGKTSMVQEADSEEWEPSDDMPPEDNCGTAADALPAESAESADTVATATEPGRPFEDVPELPDDLTEAVESMKICIIRHRAAGWRDAYCDDVLAALNALRQLALAPPEDV